MHFPNGPSRLLPIKVRISATYSKDILKIHFEAKFCLTFNTNVFLGSNLQEIPIRFVAKLPIFRYKFYSY